VFVEKYAEWEAAGIEVVPVLSQPERNEEPWQGRTGYVQTALSEDGVPVPRNTGALVCGMKGMADSVKDILVSAGVFEGRVLFNF
jgi:NAD(P)H-flavin reductase